MTSFAQAQEATLQRVEVTGSRIRQVDLETAQPVQVMSQEQVKKTGLVTVGDIINNMSVAGGYDQPGQFEQSGYSTDLAGNATRTC